MDSSSFGLAKDQFDGAARGSPGLLGTGGVIRDCFGRAIALFAAPLGVRFAFEAELFAVMLAVQKVSSLPPHPIWIESDSMLVVQMLRHRSASVPWSLRLE